MQSIIKALTVCLISSIASGCITAGVHNGVEQRAAMLRKGPDQLPHRNTTDFSESLRCMDNLFLSFGIGRFDYAVLLEEVKDKTKKVDAGTRQMVISTISEMTKRSGAIRLVNYGQDTGNLISLINEAGKKGIYEDIPPFDIVGSISQYDDGIYRKQADVSGEVAGTNDGSSLGAGGGRSASSSVTFMTIDLGVITTHNLSIVPGVTTKNSIELFSKGSSTSYDGGISKTGMSYSFSSSSKDAVGQALRALVELSTIELIGKLTKLPYWKCLGMNPQHTDIKNEISDWFYQLSSMGTLHRTLKLQLASRGYYAGAIDEEITEEYLLAVLEYKRRLGMPEVPAIDLDFYTAFLHRTPVSEHQHELAYQRRSLEIAAKQKKNKQQPEMPVLTPIEINLSSASGAADHNLGDEVFIDVSSNTDGYMNCYFQRDDAFVRVFPNRFSADGYISADGGLVLPDSARYSFVVDDSLEQIHCFLATRKIDTDLPAELQIPDLEQLPVYSIAEIEQAYARATGRRFGMASYTISAGIVDSPAN